MIVKAGICVAYDWHFLRTSLPAVYKQMHSICLSVDAERKSWNGNFFGIDWEGFCDFVNEVDVDKKISILEEPFYAPGRTPIANECYQRQRMATVLGAADWIVQLDTDETVINPSDFIDVLRQYRGKARPVNIHGIWINLIKQVESGFIYSIVKTPPLATNAPRYEYGRTNGHFNIYTNTFLAHITWARPEEEVRYKLQNWGHSHEFNGNSFYRIWDALDENNWRYIKDFHPMNKGSIPKLYFQKASDLEEFIKIFNLQEHLLTRAELLSNNLWYSRLKKFLSKSRTVK